MVAQKRSQMNKMKQAQGERFGCLRHNSEGLGRTAQPAGYPSRALRPAQALYGSPARLGLPTAWPDGLKA